MEDFQYIKKFKKSNYIQFSPKGDYIISVSGNQIVVMDSEKLNEVHVFNEIKQPGKIAFSLNNDKLFSSESAIKKLGVFDLDNEISYRIYKVTKSNEFQNHNICFSTDNKEIICGIYNVKKNTISTLDLETSKVKDLIVFENSVVKKIQYCDRSNSYLFSIFDRDGRVINGESYPITYILKWKYPFELNEPIEIRTELILEWYDISYNSNSKKYALYDWHNKIMMLTDDTLSKEVARYIMNDNRSGYFSNLNWSYDGEYIVMTFLNSVKIIRARDANCIKEFKVSSGLYSEFSPDGKLLVIGTAKSGYLVDICEFL